MAIDVLDLLFQERIFKSNVHEVARLGCIALADLTQVNFLNSIVFSFINIFYDSVGHV